MQDVIKKLTFIMITIVLIQVFLYNYNSLKIRINDLMLEETGEIENVTERKPDLKYILRWTRPFGGNIDYLFLAKVPEQFFILNCPYTNCILTENRSYLGDYSNFDVIAFVGPEIDFNRTVELPKKRSQHQKYAFISMESSENYPVCSNRLNSYFDWTWTYKLDSDLRWGYFYIRDKNNKIVGPKKEMHWKKLEDMDPVSDDFKNQLKTKTKAAVWFASHCHTRSKREEVVQQLIKELDTYNMVIDVYGTCGDLKCARGNENCEKLIKQNYYFYLAFENSFGDDYVTEKVVRALNNDAVPIVYGGANYTRFMPDGIYLNANQLSTKAIAAIMHELINDTEKYAEYFKWKNHYSYHEQYESVETLPDCLLCASLNNVEMVKKTTVYEDFRKWWNPTGRC